MKNALTRVLLSGSILALAVLGTAGLTPRAQETESTVPELIAFHDVVYPIWHTAYPEKDYGALRSYAPEVKRLAEKLYAAKLPAILHEKQAKWDQALSEFRKTVDAYLAAAAGQDDAALLEASEALHAGYETMVRTIRPVLQEIDAFHRVLYVVYHRYLPAKDLVKIKESAGELTLKAEAIAKAALPKRLEAKAQAFNAASAELLTATKALVETTKAGSAEEVFAAVEAVHTKYQSLEKIFG